jgi:hypothetical protein
MKKLIKLIFASLTLLIIGGAIFRNALAEELLLSIINERLNEVDDRLYDVSCGEVEIELISGQLALLNVKISPRFDSKDSAIIREFPVVIDGFVPKVVIEDFSWLSYWNENSLTVNEIAVYSPVVKLLLGDFVKDKTKLEKYEYSETIATLFQSVSIGRVAIIDCSVDFIKMSNPLQPIIELDSLSFFFDKIHIDSIQSKRNPFWFYENLEFNLKSVKSRIGKQYYLNAENLKVSASTKHLSLENITILPSDLTESDTVDLVNRDYMKFDISKIELNGVDYREIVQTGNIKINEINATSPKFTYFLDLVNIDTTIRKGMLPNSFLRQIKQNIRVNEVSLTNGEVTLMFKKTPFQEAVPLFFNLINANCTQISVGENWFKPRNVRLTAKGYLQEVGKLDLGFVLPLGHINDEFFVKGSLGEIPVNVLNPLIEATSYVTMPTGKIHSLDFDFIADKHMSEGRLLADYSNLSFVVLKELSDPERSRRKYNLIATFLANNMIKGNNNPRALFYREGYIDVQKEITTGFWDYLWLNFHSGISHSLMHTEGKKKSKVKKYKKKRDKISIYY